MRVYRASRRRRGHFDPLDASASVARDGWRFNDKRSEILYTTEVEALSILEGALRPGWDTVTEVAMARIEVPDGTVVDLGDLGITLPTNWNSRPAAPNARAVGAEFLRAVDREKLLGKEVCGVRVPSVISSCDHTVLLDPRQKSKYVVAAWARIAFDWLGKTPTSR